MKASERSKKRSKDFPKTSNVLGRGDENSSKASTYGSSFDIESGINRAISSISRGSEIKIKYPKSPQDVDLDKLFEFKKAQQNAFTFQNDHLVEADDGSKVEFSPEFVPHRIFVNHVNSYFGKHFVEYLIKQKYSLPKNNEDESSIGGEGSSEEVSVDDDDEEEEESEFGEILSEEISLSDDEDLTKTEEESSDEDDPFKFIQNEMNDSDEEIEIMGHLFPVTKDSSEEILYSQGIGSFDLKKLKPEEYFELLDIESEQGKIQFLSQLFKRKKKLFLKKKEGKLQKRRIKKKLKHIKKSIDFEIIGTLLQSESREEITLQKSSYSDKIRIIDDFIVNKTAFLNEIMKCGTIVFNLTPCQTDQAEYAKWTVQAITRKLQDEIENKQIFKQNTNVRTFILISSLLTWAQTAPLELESAQDLNEIPFTEEDYRRRSPHVNYSKIYRTENETLNCGKKFKTKLKTLVINCGIMYGHEEDILDYLFLQAWRCEVDTPLLAPGDNLVPLIHVDDLIKIILKCIRKSPFIKPPLFIAMEPTPLPLSEITKTISTLGTGRVQKIQKETSIVLPGPSITQETYDHLTCHINTTPVHVVENIYPHFNANFVENTNLFMEQYIEENQLKAINILIDGPPLSGKSSLAMKLCKHFNIHYLNQENIVDLYRDILESTERHLKLKEKENMLQEDLGSESMGKSSGQNLEQNDEEELRNVQLKLTELRKHMMEHGAKLEEKFLVKILIELLHMKKVSNIGYVLDGWPNTYTLATQIFQNKISKDNDMLKFELKIPNIFITLDLEEEQCLQRIYNAKAYFKKKQIDEKVLIDKALEYRKLNRENDLNLLKFFTDNKQKIIKINANDPDVNLSSITFQIGKPRAKKFWLSLNLDEDFATEEEKKESNETQDDDTIRRRDKLSQWEANFKKNKEEEEKILAIYSEPIRIFLQKNILPTLCKGLIETVQKKPEDPVDFLAEFLFKNNPNGKMYSQIQKERFIKESNGLDVFTQIQVELEKKNLQKKCYY